MRVASGFTNRTTREEAWASFLQKPSMVQDKGRTEVFTRGIKTERPKADARSLERSELFRFVTKGRA